MRGLAVKSSVRVLFNDERPMARDAVRLALQEAGFEAVPAKIDAQALDIFLDQPVDVTILGIILPILNGLRFQPVDEMPTLLIRTGEPESTAFHGSQMGSDGENVRTVHLSELLDCVRGFLQTGASPSNPSKSVYQFDGLVLDLHARQVRKHGLVIPTTPTEFRLLEYLMRHMSRVVTRDELLRSVWGCYHVSGDFNLVDTAIKRLRREIEDNPRQPRYIHTVWGMGYRFGESRNPCPEENAFLESSEPANSVLFAN
jgi:two-component system alkaline phosphatase synthesis response regulator PhoP